MRLDPALAALAARTKGFMPDGEAAALRGAAATVAPGVWLDGNHTEDVAQHDYAASARHLLPAGQLAAHDVFPDPLDGGQLPWHVVQRALGEGAFTQVGEHGSLRLLEPPPPPSPATRVLGAEQR